MGEPGRADDVTSRAPVEIWMMIMSNLDLGDLNNLSRAARSFHRRFSGYLVAWHVDKQTKSGADRAQCLHELFLHAARVDSTKLLDTLTTNYPAEFDPAGPIGLEGLGETTCFDFAVAADAPRVACRLVKAGCGFDSSSSSGSPCPDHQGALFLALTECGGPWSSASFQRCVNTGLRVACYRAMPRTARFLLARGADANAKGYASEPVVQLALKKRAVSRCDAELHSFLSDEVRWHQGRLELPRNRDRGPDEAAVEKLMGQYGPSLAIALPMINLLEREKNAWFPTLDLEGLLRHEELSLPVPSAPDEARDRNVGQTVAALLDFGAAADVRTPSAVRAHTCSYKCWRSIGCDHGGRTLLHLLANADPARPWWILATLEVLLEHGADVHLRSPCPSGGGGGGGHTNSTQNGQRHGRRGPSARARAGVTPYEMGVAHPLPLVRARFAWRGRPPAYSAVRPGPPIEEVRREMAERRVGASRRFMDAWGTRYDALADAAAFPSLGAAGAGGGPSAPQGVWSPKVGKKSNTNDDDDDDDDDSNNNTGGRAHNPFPALGDSSRLPGGGGREIRPPSQASHAPRLTRPARGADGGTMSWAAAAAGGSGPGRARRDGGPGERRRHGSVSGETRGSDAGGHGGGRVARGVPGGRGARGRGDGGSRPRPGSRA
ncbi:hypothetical protein VTH06DRAFT_7488 [Thermothelomyces fergusii]